MFWERMHHKIYSSALTSRIIPRHTSYFFNPTIRPANSLRLITRLMPMMSSEIVPSENGVGGKASRYQPRYIDIGINLADPIFRGVYNGKQRHEDDLSAVVERAHQVGCTKLIVTGSSFKSSWDALAIAKEYPNTVYTTAGIHPCSSSIFDPTHPHAHDSGSDDTPEHTPSCAPDPTAPVPESHATDPAHTAAIIAKLRDLITTSRATNALVALGEFGLDYDRLHYCSAALQRHAFRAQLALAAALAPPLPLFLHSRAAHHDFVACLQGAFGPRLERLARGGVVHSFTGTVPEMAELMELGLFIGLNGCSFKTAENCEVVRAVRLDRLMLETDGPWCDVRPTHEGWKYLVAVERKEREAEAALARLSVPAEPPSQAAPERAVEPAKTEDVNTENGDANGEARSRRPKKQKLPQQQQQQQSAKNPPKKESEVMERFKSVKKEKWVEGAMVKSRNEPCMIERVAKIVAGIKGVEVEEVCEAAWRNTVQVFGLDKS